MRYKVDVMYDGSTFLGWQIQPNTRTVQAEIEKVLYVMHKETVTITASGRTDTGVHALNQVFHFDSTLNIESHEWIRALNGQLPADIHIVNVTKVDDSFHARYGAISKTYVYRINTGEYNVFQRNYVYQYNKDIDLNELEGIFKHFLGTHDFTSFNKTPLETIENQVRTIEKIELESSEDEIIITIKGNGFLRHMIRVLVGSAIATLEGKITKEVLKDALMNPNKQSIPYIVPGCGLYLKQVDYIE